MAVTYEWVIEEIDGEDILSVDHANTYAEAKARAPQSSRIGLVRDVGNEAEGLTDRSWAYVKDGALPEHFENEMGNEIAQRVPVRFRKEVR